MFENFGTYDADEKDKTMETGIAMKSRKISDFPTCVKFGEGSVPGLASKWKVGSGSASKRCRSTTLG
jgi:hypothetical protein